MIPIQDRGFQLGDGVYETLRSVKGRLLAAERHADRLLGALEVVRITPPWNEGALIALWKEILDQNGGGDFVIRTTVTRGVGIGGFSRPSGPPTAVVQVRLLPETEELRARGITLGLVPVQRPLPFGDAIVKTLSAGAFALAREVCGADEALLLDQGGNVTEGTASALFAVVGNRIMAPPSDRVLPSVSRQLLAERVPILVQPFTAEDLRHADAIVATNISWGPVGVREFAGRGYALDHPEVKRLQAVWDSLIEEAGRAVRPQ